MSSKRLQKNACIFYQRIKMEMGEFFRDNFRITGSSSVVSFLPCNMNSAAFVFTSNAEQSYLPILWCITFPWTYSEKNDIYMNNTTLASVSWAEKKPHLTLQLQKGHLKLLNSFLFSRSLQSKYAFSNCAFMHASRTCQLTVPL